MSLIRDHVRDLLQLLTSSKCENYRSIEHAFVVQAIQDVALSIVMRRAHNIVQCLKLYLSKLIPVGFPIVSVCALELTTTHFDDLSNSQ